MPLAVLSVFIAFGLAGCGVVVLEKLRVRTWLVAFAAAIMLAVYWLALLALPFYGVLTEAPMVLLVGAALSGPLCIFFRMGEALKRRNAADAPAPERAVSFRMLALAAVLMPIAIVSLLTLLSRINYSCWLNWECHGRIISVTKDAANHGAPMLVVEDDEGRTQSFSQVDEGLWEYAQLGQRLRKEPGTPMARLDGARVRMVPRQMNWWNEPP